MLSQKERKQSVPLTCRAGTGWNSWQVAGMAGDGWGTHCGRGHRPKAGMLTLRPRPTVVEVVSVGDGDHLRLVSDQPYTSPHLRGHRTFVSPLPEETVDSLDLVPAPGSRHFWQESGSFLAA